MARGSLFVSVLTLALFVPVSAVAASDPPAPVCLSRGPTSGVYALSPDTPLCPKGVAPAKSRAGAMICFPADYRVAVIDGCVGFPTKEVGWRAPRAAATGADTFERKYDDGKRCWSGWNEHYRATKAGGLAVRRDAFSICGGGGKEARPGIELVRVDTDTLKAAGSSKLHALLEDSRPAVAAAAVERVARDQDESENCKMLAAILRAAADDPERVTHKSSVRIMELARNACLVPAVERAAGNPHLAYYAAIHLARLLPEPAARAAALLRVIDIGGAAAPDSAERLARGLVATLPPRLLRELRARLSAAGGPSRRRAGAAAAVSALLPPLDHARTVLGAARGLKRCDDRKDLLLALMRWASTAVTSVAEEEAVALFAPLVEDSRCPEARTKALLLFALRLQHSRPAGETTWAFVLKALRSDPGDEARVSLRYRIGGDTECYRPADESYPPSLAKVLRLLDLGLCP